MHNIELGRDQMLKKLRSFFSKQKAVDAHEALNLPIDGPDVLDLLWSVYTETKDPSAVRRIISVLDGRDIVREKMESWLATVVLEDRDTLSTRKLLADCVFPIDYETRTIDGSVDLDRHVALCARAGKLKFAQLPFPLEPRELLHLAMKSAALWSLKSISHQDEIVAAICNEEADIRGGASRLHLRKATI